MKNRIWLPLLAFQLLSLASFAQLTKVQRDQTIDSVLKVVTERYVFPDMAKKMEAYVRKQQAAKAYDAITDGQQFAARLTQDLRTINNDKHINIEYSPEAIPPEEERELMTIPPAEKEGYAQMMKHLNYGIRKVDVLKGNIGYLDFEFMCSPEFAGDTYAAAMNYLAHTGALIIDLRNCGGSMSPDAIPFLCSYFFENPVHLVDWYWRKNNAVKQAWTYSYVSGKKYLDKPIYILTSNKTFSGAEEMAYDLQNLKRATIIGQPSGGGANPGGFLRVTDHFRMFVPIGQAISPITKTNWEGVGVKPDTLINTKLALTKAHMMGITHTMNTTDIQPWKEALQNWLKELENTKLVLKPITFELKDFPNAKEVYVAGSFNEWNAGSHKMQRKGNSWVLTTEAEPGKVVYKFIVDGKWITDPDNTATETNGPNTDSVKFISKDF
ncbi:S41 family peptidase [Flavisolibacter tropicus]|uniref:S41 family peptidase n=1 Tax=Flavisolibacter tropicus TaxID=1492898 RepID=UPI00082AAB48|nr:S41 family peptidase [Flavisolibacter tropicus]